MDLHKLAENLWSVEQPLRFPGGFTLGVRTVVVGLPSGGVAVLSPAPELGRVRAQLEALGPVRALVAPNLLHHLGLPAAQAAWPAARVFRRPGLEAKRPDVRFTDVLTEVAPELWSGVMSQVEVGGMPKVQEVAFVHHPSRTLLLTDLCFNVRSAPNLFTRLFMKLNGAYGHFGPSRLGRSYMKDRAAVRASVERLLAHDFDRIVVAHGDVLETGGREELERAFTFLRG